MNSADRPSLAPLDRVWWLPPRNFRDRHEERPVIFLELFYDLVFVVVIAEIAHGLAAHFTLKDMGVFALMFVFVWWAWINGALMHAMHGNNDLRSRVFTFIQMLLVATMAVFAHDPLGKGRIGFALSFALLLALFAFLWHRTSVFDPSHRAANTPYVVAGAVASVAFAGSVFLPSSYTLGIWSAGIAVGLLMPMGRNLRLGDRSFADDGQPVLPMVAVERFGLFTIIVLGEVIVGVVAALAGLETLPLGLFVTGGLGITLAIGLWWIYFDFVALNQPPAGGSFGSAYVFLHLPLTLSIAAIGAAMFNVIEHADATLPIEVRWSLVGMTSVALVVTSLLTLMIERPEQFAHIYPTARRAMFASAAVVLAFGFLPVGANALLALLVAALLTPVVFAIRVWIKTHRARVLSASEPDDQNDLDAIQPTS